MPTKSYSITPEKFAGYFAQLPAQGFAVKEGNSTPPNDYSGQVTGRGVTISYTYDGSTLILTGQDKPFFVSWNYVWNLISEHLA